MNARAGLAMSLLSFLAACGEIPEGRYACSMDAECPKSWFCVSDRCWSQPSGGSNPVICGGVDCNDMNPCTRDSCADGTNECVNEPYVDGAVCGTDRQCCGGVCVDPSKTAPACGPSCVDCGANSVCNDGACGCAPGFVDCDAAQPGCETNPATSAEHCDGCGLACSADQSCIEGACTSCTSPAQCPIDDRACLGAPACNAGVCEYPIIAGTCFVDGACHQDGDLNPANACEVCDAAAAAAAWTLRLGLACSDGEYCTVGETCDESAQCTGGTPRGACGFECDEENNRCCGEVGQACCAGGVVENPTLQKCCPDGNVYGVLAGCP